MSSDGSTNVIATRQQELVAQDERTKQLVKELAPFIDEPDAPFDPKRDGQRLRFHGEEVVRNMFEMGKILVRAKGFLGHGEWEPWIERHLPISKRTAYNYMTFTKRIVETGVKQLTGPDVGIGKALELLTSLTDEDIQALDGGEELDGVGTLGDVGRMTKSELRTALIARRDEVKEQAAQIEEGGAELDAIDIENNDLRRELAKRDGKIAQASIDNWPQELVAIIEASAQAAKVFKLVPLDIRREHRQDFEDYLNKITSTLSAGFRYNIDDIDGSHDAHNSDEE